MEQMISSLQELQDNFNTTVEKMGNNIKEFGKTLDNEVSKFDYYADVQKTLKNIIDLSNRNLTDIDTIFLNGLNQSNINNSINKMTGTKR